MTTDSRPPDWAVARAFWEVRARNQRRKKRSLAHEINVELQDVIKLAAELAGIASEIAEEAK